MADENMKREALVTQLHLQQAANAIVAGLIEGMRAAHAEIAELVKEDSAIDASGNDLRPYVTLAIQALIEDFRALEVRVGIRDTQGKMVDTVDPRTVLQGLGMACNWLP